MHRRYLRTIAIDPEILEREVPDYESDPETILIKEEEEQANEVHVTCHSAFILFERSVTPKRSTKLK